MNSSRKAIGTQMKAALLAVLTAFAITACVPPYKLVRPGAKAVGDGAMTVTAATAWNQVPVAQKATWEESWTRNGPLLDSVLFVSGLPEGKALVKQRRKADAQVALFKADMSPDDLVSMVEGAYRVGGITVFTVDSVEPAPFLGGTGLRMRYHYAPSDGIGKKGAAVLRVVGGKLYLMKLDGVSSHYFDAALPEFDQMAASARLAK